MHKKALTLLNTYNVLVVEDDEIAREMIKQGLKKYCESFYEAGDGLQGLEQFKKHRIDLIVTDIHLPSLNGLEMIKEILILKPNQLFLVMTSFDTDENILKSMRKGACQFLSKPIDINDLQTALIISSSRLHQGPTKLTKNITVDARKELILKDGEPIFLSYKQNKIFWLLYYNLSRVVTYEMFEDYVHENESINKSVLHVAILRIKQKLEGIEIKNIVNMGYVMQESDN
jgi:DNA-binding response OmpR family regulator